MIISSEKLEINIEIINVRKNNLLSVLVYKFLISILFFFEYKIEISRLKSGIKADVNTKIKTANLKAIEK